MAMKVGADSLSKELIEQYGYLISLKNLVHLLQYPTVSAAQRAISRGHFPISVTRLQNRNGYYATAPDVARYLLKIELEMKAKTIKEDDMN
jgi:hypothetical protein